MLLFQIQTATLSSRFDLEPQLLGAISPLAACFTYKQNQLSDYPFIEVCSSFNEKKMCISKDRVHTLQRLVFPGKCVLHFLYCSSTS